MISSLLPVTEQNTVREQLDRILADHLFRNSKRFPDFLRYTVGHALSGHTEDIKERTLGIEVFGRDPSYDTSLDPVVRMTAAEVRKRLAQVLSRRQGTKTEMRIDFRSVRRIPEFRFPTSYTDTSATSGGNSECCNAPRSLGTGSGLPYFLFVASLLSTFVWSKIAAPQDLPLDRFWAPVEGFAVSSPSVHSPI